MTTVVLVRHGQASFGAPNYDRLSPIGERQAVILGDHWQRSGFAFDSVFCGTLQRQRRTAELALASPSGATAVPMVDAAFNEFNHTQLLKAYLPIVAADDPALCDPATAVLKDPALFRPLFHKVVAAWTRDLPASSPIDESWGDFCTRCSEGVRRAAQGVDRVVAFTSGGVITAVLREALGLDHDTALRMNWRILNASVHEFHLTDKGLNLVGFNEISHLRLMREETLITRL